MSSEVAGSVIRSGRVCPESVKIEAIKNFEPPTTKTGVRSFLGLTGYYCTFLPPLQLRCLTRKTQPNRVARTPECATTFDQLKRSLFTSPVLKSRECPDRCLRLRSGGQFLVSRMRKGVTHQSVGNSSVGRGDTQLLRRSASPSS